jgi:hypothetical protein
MFMNVQVPLRGQLYLIFPRILQNIMFHYFLSKKISVLLKKINAALPQICI